MRTLRIAWEVIKTFDPDGYVTLSGTGYPSFLDAVCRQTDNPNGGGVNAQFPLKGGAYFDVIGFHSYPHFDGSTKYWDNNLQQLVYVRHSDGAADGLIRTQETYDIVLNNYGYNGNTFPEKVWTITEGNVPGLSFNGDLGGVEAQRNFIIKAVVAMMKK